MQCKSSAALQTPICQRNRARAHKSMRRRKITPFSDALMLQGFIVASLGIELWIKSKDNDISAQASHRKDWTLESSHVQSSDSVSIVDSIGGSRGCRCLNAGGSCYSIAIHSTHRARYCVMCMPMSVLFDHVHNMPCQT